MSTLELKSRIQDFLEHADERILNIVNGVFENYYQQETVAFYPDGTPITRKEYKGALDTAEKQIETGDYISVEQMWLNDKESHTGTLDTAG